MTPSRTYSHLHGAEYLLIKNPAIFAEVKQLIHRHFANLQPNFEKTLQYRARHAVDNFKRSAEKLGWRDSRVGLKKDCVALAFHLPEGPTPLLFEEIIGSRILDYSDGKIDVGIEILPVRSRQNMNYPGTNVPTPNFDLEVAKIIQHGRTIPRVPLVLIGVSI